MRMKKFVYIKHKADKSYAFWEKDLKKAPGNKHLTSGGIYYSVIFLFSSKLLLYTTNQKSAAFGQMRIEN